MAQGRPILRKRFFGGWDCCTFLTDEVRARLLYPFQPYLYSRSTIDMSQVLCCRLVGRKSVVVFEITQNGNMPRSGPDAAQPIPRRSEGPQQLP